MLVKKTLETPSGAVTFEGELNQEEVDLIISVGLNFLMQQGAVPFKVMREENRAKFAKGSDEKQ